LLRKAQTFNRAEPFAAGQRTADILRESADLVRRAGMTPVFVTTPVSPMLLADLDVSRVCALTNGVAAIAAECGAAYLNCLDVPIPVECWHDANHLNAEGAKLFSEMFSRDFANREAEL
jgi:lysophospholipase L1-like esterase